MTLKRNIFFVLFATTLIMTGCTSKEEQKDISLEETFSESSTEESSTIQSSENTLDDSSPLLEEAPAEVIPEPEDLSNIDDDYFDSEPLNASAKEEMSIFFSNTSCIDSNDALPLQAQIRLMDDTIKFLSASGYTDTFEVAIIDNTFEKTESSTSFICTLDAYPGVQIKISYIHGTGLFDFTTIAWEDPDESEENNH